MPPPIFGPTSHHQFLQHIFRLAKPSRCWQASAIRRFTTSEAMSASSKVLTVSSINPHVLAAQYAVRGLIPQQAESYRARIAAGDGAGLPFDDVVFANIGNPQQLDQKPLTFFRQVASLLEFPLLLDHEKELHALGYETDAVERARRLLLEVKSVGAYSNSAGAPGIKKSVAEFIHRESWSLPNRRGVQPDTL
jgi:hypothetical protein